MTFTSECLCVCVCVWGGGGGPLRFMGDRFFFSFVGTLIFLTFSKMMGT